MAKKEKIEFLVKEIRNRQKKVTEILDKVKVRPSPNNILNKVEIKELVEVRNSLKDLILSEDLTTEEIEEVGNRLCNGKYPFSGRKEEKLRSLISYVSSDINWSLISFS